MSSSSTPKSVTVTVESGVNFNNKLKYPWGDVCLWHLCQWGGHYSGMGMTVIITAYHYEDSGVQIRFLVYAINGKELDGYPSLDFKTVQYPHDEWERFLEFVLENETFREDFRLVMLEQSTLLSSWKRSRRTDTFFNWSDDQEPDTKKRKASDEQEPATKKPKASVTGTAEQAASEQPAEEATAILAEQAAEKATEQ